MGFLEVIMSDFKRLEEETKSAETQAQAEYGYPDIRVLDWISSVVSSSRLNNPSPFQSRSVPIEVFLGVPSTICFFLDSSDKHEF